MLSNAQIGARPAGAKIRIPPQPSLPAYHRAMDLAVANLLRLAVTLTAVVDSAWVVSVGADVGQSSLVAEGLVDASELTAVVSSRAGDLDRALALGVAVAAGAVQLAVVLDVEVDDVDLAAAVVLDDLVVSVVGTTADDVLQVVSMTPSQCRAKACLRIGSPGSRS